MYTNRSLLGLLSLMLMSPIVGSSCVRNRSSFSIDPSKQFPIAAEQVTGLRCVEFWDRKTSMGVKIPTEDMKDILSAINRSANVYFEPPGTRSGRPPILFVPTWELQISTQDGQVLAVRLCRRGTLFSLTWPIDAKKGKYRSRNYELAPDDMDFVRSVVIRYMKEK